MSDIELIPFCSASDSDASESEEIEKPKTYEEIRADVLGNPLRDVPDLKENYGYTKSERWKKSIDSLK